VYSVRINLDYRAVGVQVDDEMVWFWTIQLTSDYYRCYLSHKRDRPRLPSTANVLFRRSVLISLHACKKKSSALHFSGRKGRPALAARDFTTTTGAPFG
jgi:hypothetical protein